MNTRNLKRLRKELSESGNLLKVSTPAGLLLHDVCSALELSPKQRREVLGAKLEREIEAYLDSRPVKA
jgi:hypothetical protein